MGIRVYKPTSAGRRNASVHDFSEITKTKPEKSLVFGLRKKGGRNNQGRITCRHRGGGHKRLYRKIDFKVSGAEWVPIITFKSAKINKKSRAYYGKNAEIYST